MAESLDNDFYFPFFLCFLAIWLIRIVGGLSLDSSSGDGRIRIVQVGRGHWRSSNPSPLLRAGLAAAGCPGQCPVGFRISPKD